MEIPQLMITATRGKSVIVMGPDLVDSLSADLKEAGLTATFEDPKHKTIGFRETSTGAIERIASDSLEETDERIIWLDDPKHEVFGVVDSWIRKLINA